MRTLIVGGLIVAALGLIATGTFAQPEILGGQWKIALEHSKLAQKATSPREIKQHLQHVINCVEGANGSGFEAGPGNPCEGKGKGLMADMKTAGGKYVRNMHWMQLTTGVAQLGRKATTADMAKAAAWATEKVLEETGNVLR